MWTIDVETLPDGRGLRCVVHRASRPAAYAAVLQGLQGDPAFRSLFNAALADAPFSAFRWETPPVTSATSSRPFEFVLLDSPVLAPTPQPAAFAAQFRAAADTGVVAFRNLGGDAILVVPCEIAEPASYAHLAAFVRNAPEEQRHALWQLVGKETSQRLDTRPVWLSTAGDGVSWLHVRLDDAPKYYGFVRYRQMAP
ncbi:MAG: hypothetical protein E4H03_11640 [Myxococcales bacterium]|jgi:hypothetical protein|nr:MAG: hypothetical protein E4H03_11640 [Myxococcales bacterium]